MEKRLFKDVVSSQDGFGIGLLQSYELAKNHDYAGRNDADGLRNFNLTANVAGVSTPQGILVRLMDKMTRTGNLLTQVNAVKDEAIEDTLMDAINYCAILLFALKQEQE